MQSILQSMSQLHSKMRPWLRQCLHWVWPEEAEKGVRPYWRPSAAPTPVWKLRQSKAEEHREVGSVVIQDQMSILCTVDEAAV